MTTRKKQAARPGSFEEAFEKRLSSIEERGHKVGLTLTHICREAGVARATPDRWSKEAPKSIRLVDELEAVVIRAEQAAVKAAGQDAGQADQKTP